MRRARHARRPLLAGLAALVVLVTLAVILAGRSGSEEPASRAALERIAAKNREAALVSAVQMKTQSTAAAAAADARIAAETEAEAHEPTR
jgi:hypothetical protein